MTRNAIFIYHSKGVNILNGIEIDPAMVPSCYNNNSNNNSWISQAFSIKKKNLALPDVQEGSYNNGIGIGKKFYKSQ